MSKDLGASQANGLGSSKEPEPSGLGPTGAIPSADKRIADLVEALKAARDFLAGTSFQSGDCCCGEPISAHDPYHSNHAPKDALAYQASLLCERIASALPPEEELGEL